MSNLTVAIDSLQRFMENDQNSNSESKDTDRKELMWEEREELFMRKIVEECKTQSELHRKKGKYFKKMYTVFGVPSMLIPIILSGLVDQLHDYALVQSLLMIGTGIFSGISNFFNFGRKYQEHFDFENKYNGLAGDIGTELVKPKAFRVAADVYLERIRLLYGNLNDNAPLVASPIEKKRTIR